jgi:hypothetical protein
MAFTCIPSDKAEEFKKSLRDGDIKIADLLDPKMTSEARTAIFEKYAGDQAKSLNLLFEEKLVLKNRMTGIKNFLSKVGGIGKFSEAGKAEIAKTLSDFRASQQQKIFSPTEYQAYLNDLADKKVGFHVTIEETRKISDLQAKINDLKPDAQKQQFGTSVELDDAQTEMSTYMNSLDERPGWKSILNSAAAVYKNLFIGVKTGIKTGVLGTLNSAVEVLNRRATGGVRIGDVPLSDKIDALKGNISFFSKTGNNTFLKTSLDDTSNLFGSSKKGINENFGGKENIKPGILKPVAQAANLAARGIRYVAIDVLHKLPMLINSSLSFVDASDITSSQLAKTPFAIEKGMDARAIFKDSLKVEPETELGKIARDRSRQETFRLLNINNTPLSEAAVNLQKTLNKIVPNAHIGDYVLPMAKVPSSIIYNGLESFGGGFGTGMKDVIQGMNKLRDLKKVDNAGSLDGVKATMQMRDGFKTLTRTVGTIAAAYLITQGLTKKDVKSDSYGNISIRMGNYWISTDAFGQGGTAIGGMALGRSQNTGFIEDYTKGGFSSLLKAPVVSDASSMIQKGVSGGVGGIGSSLANSYLKPILLQDIQKSMQQNSLRPIFVGSLIKTNAEVDKEKKASAQKSTQTRRSNALAKNKPQTLY